MGPNGSDDSRMQKEAAKVLKDPVKYCNGSNFWLIGKERLEIAYAHFC